MFPLTLSHFTTEVLHASLRGAVEFAFLGFKLLRNDLQEFNLFFNLLQRPVYFTYLRYFFSLYLSCSSFILVPQTLSVPLLFKFCFPQELLLELLHNNIHFGLPDLPHFVFQVSRPLHQFLLLRVDALYINVLLRLCIQYV